MLSTLTSSEPSTDFVCPHCGVSAFETVPAPSELDGDMDDSATLFLRCFGCDHVFRHPLEIMHVAMADTAG